MKKLFLIPIALVLVGCGGGAGIAATTFDVYRNTIVGNVSPPCIGPAKSRAEGMTNSGHASIWYAAPAGTTSGFVTNMSPVVPSTNVVIVRAVRRVDGASFCGTNAVTFPVAAGGQFNFAIFDKYPGAVAGTMRTNSVTWLP